MKLSLGKRSGSDIPEIDRHKENISFIKKVQDVVIPVYKGASKHLFVYRLFLLLDPQRNILLYWVGRRVTFPISTFWLPWPPCICNSDNNANTGSLLL